MSSSRYRSDASSQPTSPPPTQTTTTAQLLEANKQKRLYAREEFLHHNSSSNERGGVKPVRRHHREIGTPENSMRSASIDYSEDVFAGSSRARRMSSPFSINKNVLTASLKIPVQLRDDIANIPYIEEDRGDYSSAGRAAVIYVSAV